MKFKLGDIVKISKQRYIIVGIDNDSNVQYLTIPEGKELKITPSNYAFCNKTIKGLEKTPRLKRIEELWSPERDLELLVSANKEENKFNYYEI